MSEALAHRGPDGAGRWVDPREGVVAGLVHRRLAVIDLACGSQPMGNEDGRVQVVFNGEIYNHAELRNELKRLGHLFSTDHSDTEVLVHGWEAWGVELPKRLRGMFAFAVWDWREGPGGGHTFFMARDRMGQKPLFYATLEDGIVFGSTIGSVLAWPEVPRRVPRGQVGLYLQVGYVPSPQTVWRDVSQVMPGGWVRVRGEVVDGGRYWVPEGVEGGDLRGTVQGAVRSQLVSDVPIACFLSGGIDSSIVAALMQEEVRKAGGAVIHTVSVGFRESGFDETAYARAVAEKIGSRHTRLEVSMGGDVVRTLAMLMERSLGQPFADSSILPTYHLSKAVREVAPVALSGDGADELFGGYDRYRGMRLLGRWGGMARWMPGASPVGSHLRRERYRRFVAAARGRGVAERYTRMVEIFPLVDAEELVGTELESWVPERPEYVIPGGVSAMRYAMLRDQQDYLPNDVLWKVDSAAMAVALEVRSPFMDHEVVSLANGLRDEQLVQGKRGKVVLRETFARELPEVVKGRGKKGFGVPIGEWFRGKLGGELRELMTGSSSFVAGQLDGHGVKRLMDEHTAGARDHTHRLFALLMLELWGRAFKPSVE